MREEPCEARESKVMKFMPLEVTPSSTLHVIFRVIGEDGRRKLSVPM